MSKIGVYNQYMNDTKIEEWWAIPSHPNYAASNHGQIKRLTSRTSGKAGKIRKQTKNFSSGYFILRLSDDGIIKTYTVHSLIAETFLVKPKNDFQVNHKNGDKTDNRIENLEYVSRQENIRHSYRLGLQSKEQNQGAKNGRAKLTETEVANIIAEADRSIGVNVRLAKKYDVTPNNISRILSGKTWKHLHKT